MMRSAGGIMKGQYIVFEGMDGCGKDTQLDRFALLLEEKYQIPNIKILEPGETELGQTLRQILKNPPFADTLSDEERVMLFCVDRSLTRRQVIEPALAEGKWVLSARSRISTDAYQGFAGGIDLDIIKILCDFVMQSLVPDRIYFFDVSVDVALSRISGRQGDTEDYFDSQKKSFHEKVYEGYQWAYRNYQPQTVRIDASKDIEDVFDELVESFEQEFMLAV